MAAYLEHMALRVRDFDWHVAFFKEVFGMTERLYMGEAPHRKIWLHAGLQLNEDVTFEGGEGRADHLGMMVEDVEEVVRKARALGAKPHPMGDNWFILPEGLAVEVQACKTDVMKEIIAKEPWL